MDDIRDQMDLANEISEAISQPVGFGVEFDEDELNQELEDLEQEELDAKLLDTGVTDLNLPNVPTSVPGIFYLRSNCRSTQTRQETSCPG
jgi:charged multivesicular body protein 4